MNTPTYHVDSLTAVEPYMITEPSMPEEPIDTTRFGIVSYKTWLHLEAERLARSGINTVIAGNGCGRIVLIRVIS